MEGDDMEWDELSCRPDMHMKMSDPDVYAEVPAWVDRFEEVVWAWHRGHPEKRKCPEQYDIHDQASVVVDVIAEIQYEAWPPHTSAAKGLVGLSA